MSKERFEVFGNVIKDNEDIPSLLNNYQATVRLNELNDRIKELEQELAELKEKDNYHLRYELAGADETITNLKQQLEEKDKEIEELKLKLDIRAMNLQNINTERMEAVRNQTQLAIQELAEVERLLYESHYKEIDNRYYAEYEDIKNLIDSRIQALEELKGE